MAKAKRSIKAKAKVKEDLSFLDTKAKNARAEGLVGKFFIVQDSGQVIRGKCEEQTESHARLRINTFLSCWFSIDRLKAGE